MMVCGATSSSFSAFIDVFGTLIRVVHASPIQPQLVPQLGLNFDLNSQDLNLPNRKFSRVEVKVEAF
jgi:hypothetical protein